MTTLGTWPDMKKATGISFMRSEIRFGDVLDGSSNTYLIGEKYLNVDSYENGADGADNENMYCGYNNDNHRTTIATWTVMQDRSAFEDPFVFGSAHVGAFNMSFCDSSVRAISYAIDKQLHRRLGNREDGEAVNLGNL
jgi:hypothetical protein